MGEFHRTYSKVWWPNLDLEDSLSPSSSPSSSNGSHRSQDSGFSDSSTSKQNATAEQHLRNFAHTPENQMYSSPEPCEGNDAADANIILPESQYAETPIRMRKPAAKAIKPNDGEKDKRATPQRASQCSLHEDGTTLKRIAPDYSDLPLDPNYKPKSLIDTEKMNYLRKKDHRKSMGSVKNNDKNSSVDSKKNRHSMSLNLVTLQNEENINPRLCHSYSEQQTYQRQPSSSNQNRRNEFFKDTRNFQPYRPDKDHTSLPRVIEIKTKATTFVHNSETKPNTSKLPSHTVSPCSNQNIIASTSCTERPQRIYPVRVETNTITAAQNVQKDFNTRSPVCRLNDKSGLAETRNQSTSERNSVLLQRLNPAERQLLENLTANYFSKSNSLDKDESMYENIEKNLDSKVNHDKVQKVASTSLKHPHENRNSVSLNITSTAFNETITPLNHSVDNHIYNSTEIYEPSKNLQRYHTYSQICDQDSNCFIKKWENSMSESSTSQSNFLDNISDTHESQYNTNQLTQDSTYSGNSSNLTEGSYYLPIGSSYISCNSQADQNNHGDLSVNKTREFNPTSSTVSASSQEQVPNIRLLEIGDQSILESSMLSESINSVLSRHRSKSNDCLDRSQGVKSQNSSLNNSFSENRKNQRHCAQNQRLEEQTHDPENLNTCEALPSTSNFNNNSSKSNVRMRLRHETQRRRPSRVNRHSANFENGNQEHLNEIRRCKSLNNLETNQPTPKPKALEEHILRGGKSFVLSNLDLIEPPHFTSTPKKVPRPTELQLHRRRPIPPTVIVTSEKDDLHTSRSTDPPVSHWLRELSQRYDAEYMTALQSKALISERLGESQILSGPASQYVLNLQEKIRTISSEFTKLLRQIEKHKWELIGPLSQSLLGLIEQFLSDYHVTSSHLRQECESLRSEAFRDPPNGEKLKTRVSSLGRSFAAVVDQILFDQIKMFLSTLETIRTPSVVLSTLSSLTKLGLDSAHLGDLVARYPGGGIRIILSVCLEVPCTHVTICALRTITLLCASVQCIRQLEQCNGIEILADILADEARDETVLSEAISVLAQVTAPWLDTNQSVADLHLHVDTFVAALTRLMRKQLNSETLLLISAALANLSFMELKAVWSMVQHNSIGILLTAVRKLATRASVFLQEQTATLIANMAAIPEARPNLAQARAVVALLCFLQTRASPLQRAAEIMASERLQHKSAIALSRLCSDVEIARQVVDLQGVNRLVNLCKEERERNHSDGVLVACLAALRKITTNCGTDTVEELNAIELVEPNLLDSFMLYSSKQESCV